MHKSILALILTISFFPAKAMKVALDGEFLAIESRLEGCHSIRYEFSRCMANHIYTFSRVLVDSVVVNEATSDNIGPFLIESSGWTGGNHLLPDGSPSARTDHPQREGRTAGRRLSWRCGVRHHTRGQHSSQPIGTRQEVLHGNCLLQRLRQQYTSLRHAQLRQRQSP